MIQKAKESLPGFEKLGAFYLGKLFDPEAGAVRDDLLLYDAKDLTTHAVCVGMTGSGKTGLCLSLLEEAAIDGVPALVIDPKGDLGNLLLTFPRLEPGDFRPWIDDGEAATKGLSSEEYAGQVASRWRKGLADWGQDGERIARFESAADVAIYTPGSSAGLPLKVLRSFSAPPKELVADADSFRERVAAAASGLLALLGIDADPIRSREHILISNILQHAWKEGRDLDIAELIREIQSPPFERIGVMDLESFFPSRDRFALAMTLNNLLASPGFSAWLEGEPLDIPSLLWNAEGKPRISILSIAHLSDAERMFFVTLLLNEVVAWMRTQPGTGSLRAILYMDEVFGFFPPTANPPSKTPMLTLLKQARAYGLGVVLATQNPVDLDYKGLSNAGTWFLGRLQTERDKARVLEGLEGASRAAGARFDRKKLEETLARLDSRVFLMNNVHEDEPVIFHTRWVLSYLRGPLTRKQIQTLMATRKRDRAEPERKSPGAAVAAARPVRSSTPEASKRPLLPPGLKESFLRWRGSLERNERLLYRPALLGAAKLHFVRAGLKVDEWQDLALFSELDEDTLSSPWSEAHEFEDGEPTLEPSADPEASYAALPAKAARARSYSRWKKQLRDSLYRNRIRTFWRCRELKATSSPGESEGQFRVRLNQLAHEKRDREVEKLRKRFAPKLARLQDRIRRAEERVAREQSQYGQQKMQTAISFGATILGALFGRKLSSARNVGRATTAVRGVGRAARERGDIARAREELEIQRQKLGELEATFEEETATIQDAMHPDLLELEPVELRPRKSDIAVDEIALLWLPYRVSPDGLTEAAFR